MVDEITNPNIPPNIPTEPQGALPPVPDLPAFEPKLSTSPVDESGPAALVPGRGKWLRYGVVMAVALVGVGVVLAAYILLRGMAVPKEVPEVVEVQETTETTETQKTSGAQDTTSLDALGKSFDEMGIQLSTLEQDTTFEQEANLSSQEF